MKPYYRKDGTYKDGNYRRVRISIEAQIGDKRIRKKLPKPEIMLKIMSGCGWQKILKEIKEQKDAGQIIN